MTQRRRLVHRKLGTTQLHQPYQHHQVSLTHAAIDLYRIIHRTLNMQSAMTVPFTSNLCNHSFCSWRSFFAVAVMKFMALNTSDVVWDKSGLKPKKVGLGLSGLVLRCETRSCHARRYNDLAGYSNFSSTIYSFCILFLEHHYCGDQQFVHLHES